MILSYQDEDSLAVELKKLRITIPPRAVIEIIKRLQARESMYRIYKTQRVEFSGVQYGSKRTVSKIKELLDREPTPLQFVLDVVASSRMAEPSKEDAPSHSVVDAGLMSAFANPNAFAVEEESVTPNVDEPEPGTQPVSLSWMMDDFRAEEVSDALVERVAGLGSSPASGDEWRRALDAAKKQIEPQGRDIEVSSEHIDPEDIRQLREVREAEDQLKDWDWSVRNLESLGYPAERDSATFNDLDKLNLRSAQGVIPKLNPRAIENDVMSNEGLTSLILLREYDQLVAKRIQAEESYVRVLDDGQTAEQVDYLKHFRGTSRKTNGLEQYVVTLYSVIFARRFPEAPIRYVRVAATLKGRGIHQNEIMYSIAGVDLLRYAVWTGKLYREAYKDAVKQYRPHKAARKRFINMIDILLLEHGVDDKEVIGREDKPKVPEVEETNTDGHDARRVSIEQHASIFEEQILEAEEELRE